MLDNLNKYDIVLASNSPRRRELLAGLGVKFRVETIKGLDETYDPAMPLNEVAAFLSQLKASAYTLAPSELIITADTIVLAGDEVMGKPADRDDAHRMLRKLSGCSHEVITGVTVATQDKKVTFSNVTQVTFAAMTDEEIYHYIDTYAPFDKAGAYGIQEWIGYMGVTGINGCFYNVMGLPVNHLYTVLKEF
ncbi:Maf family nucleotide pyrophosphatase [Sodaliphilus sp.]|uniref:Maf family nucleotide pyrophosphatase n=1 Tax=Sodaliphilus sp. TaxID=2815818 RepID=UPI00388D6B53